MEQIDSDQLGICYLHSHVLILVYFWNKQYIHGLAARGVHYLHQPGPTLQDLGFMILPVCTTHALASNLVYVWID